MFTGIIEDVGTVTQIKPSSGNIDISVRSTIATRA